MPTSSKSPKVFDRAGFIFAWVFDPRSFFDLKHHASNLFLQYWTTPDSAHSIYKMSEFPKRSLNSALKSANVSWSEHAPNCRGANL